MNTIAKMIKKAYKENKETVIMIDYCSERVYSVIGDRLSVWHSRNGERISRSCFYKAAFYERNEITLASGTEPDVVLNGVNYYSL